VSTAEVVEKVVQNLMFFLRPKFWGSPKLYEGICKSTPTGQVWLTSYGWSFIYADEVKKEK